MEHKTRKTTVAILVILLFCSMSCVGLIYAYSSSIVTDAPVDADFYDIKISNGDGEASYSLVIDPDQRMVFDSVVKNGVTTYSVNSDDSAQFTFNVVLGHHDADTTRFHVTEAYIHLYADEQCTEPVSKIGTVCTIDSAANQVLVRFIGEGLTSEEIQDEFTMMVSIKTENGPAPIAP